MVTSTASRLAVVQREIDNLATSSTPTRPAAPSSCGACIAELRQQIDALQAGSHVET